MRENPAPVIIGIITICVVGAETHIGLNPEMEKRGIPNNGEITDVQCQHCLAATNLGKQYVFVTRRALDRVTLLERCFLAEDEKDYYLRSRQDSFQMNQDKVKLARKQYRNQGKYIEDILE